MRFMLTVAWRNLFRQTRRSLITASAMAFGMAVCMGMIALTDGMYAQFYEVLVERRLGHVQVHHPDYPFKRQLHDTIRGGDDMMAALQDDPLVKGLSGRLFGQALVGGDERSTGAQLLGVRPELERSVTRLAEQVEQGRFLSEQAAGEAVVGEGLAETLHLGVGDELVVITQAADGSMGNALMTISGVFRSGSQTLDRSGVYVHLDDLRGLLALEGQLHEIIVTTYDVDDAEALRADVEAARSEPELLVRTWDEADPSAAQMMKSQTASTAIMLGAIFGVAAIGVLNTMLMAVLERTRELGVLRALGLSPGRLMSLVILESMMLGAVACVAGGVLGGLFDAYLVVYGVDWSVGDGEGLSQMGVTLDPIVKAVVEPGSVVATIASLFAVCVLASVWPAVRAARLSPVEAMREV
ncbi:MAG: ABC transporter permease [Alphaproteobacteria bacterium]|nr:ABC transporter permease [Alphaproteobacteria bacterium]MCB9794533.1 ABC transporter permease [Alphaproteobacteria bacterium]